MSIKEFIKKNVPFIVKTRLVLYKFLVINFPIYMTKRYYKKKMGRNLNLIEPRDLNEKIQWLKLFSDTTKWSDLADKYKVREYVKKCGFGDMLNELYGVWNSPKDIDFNELPNQFVLKTNNGSGDVVIVKDKSKIDENIIREQLQLYLNRDFGVFTVEPHYLQIFPRIICEKFLKETTDISSSLIDYKFYCSYGKVLGLMVCFDREIGVHAEKVIYDIENWIPKYEYVKTEFISLKTKKIIPRPNSLNKMLEASSVLSKEFPLVRVDFYEIDNKAIFGEMTFTSEAGCIMYLTEDFLRKMGDKVNIDNIKYV